MTMFLSYEKSSCCRDLNKRSSIISLIESTVPVPFTEVVYLKVQQLSLHEISKLELAA